MGKIILIKKTPFILDDEDFDKISKFKWSLLVGRDGQKYARFNMFMHREILSAPFGMVVDHIDRDGLNNTKNNLRICSKGQNSYNSKGSFKTSRFKGVSRKNGHKRWGAAICHRGKNYELGFFNTEEEAAISYDREALHLFGEYAYLNFSNKKEENLDIYIRNIFIKYKDQKITCKVDEEKYKYLSKYKWYLFKTKNNSYAMRCCLMHRLIMGIDYNNDFVVDHINGNTCDNRKINLRVCKDSYNKMNTTKQKGNYTSKYKGVSWDKKLNKWLSRAYCNCEAIHIGYFDNEIIAAKKYNQKVKDFYGDFARLNKFE